MNAVNKILQQISGLGSSFWYAWILCVIQRAAVYIHLISLENNILFWSR